MPTIPQAGPLVPRPAARVFFEHFSSLYFYGHIVIFVHFFIYMYTFVHFFIYIYIYIYI